MDDSQAPRWDLTPLVASTEVARERISALLEDAKSFAAAYRGRLTELDAAGLVELLEWLGRIKEEDLELQNYSLMREDADANDLDAKDLHVAYDQGSVALANEIRFFELEWLLLPKERARTLAEAPELVRDRHFLLSLRRFASHRLSDSDERMFDERGPAAESAWQSLYGDQLANVSVLFDSGNGPEPQNIEQLTNCLLRPERALRQAALEAMFDGLEPRLEVLARCYDTLVGDRLVRDRLFAYPGPMAEANLENELTAEAVDYLLEVVVSNYPLARRWFEAKAPLLGLERLGYADQYAPLGRSRQISWEEAQGLVLDAFGSFSPQVRASAEAFFTEQRIDAEPRPGKCSGAYCADMTSRVKSFILMSFSGDLANAVALAHELGHGLQFEYSAASQSPNSAAVGTALAEVASTFSELLFSDFLLAREQDPELRLGLLARRVEAAFASVFRQTMMTRYEQRAYALRQEGQSLSPERLSVIWLEENERYLGGAVELPERYRCGWSYVPHFVSNRFYTYAYSFAHLVALALYARYRKEGEGFVEKMLAFLSSGSSGSPEELLAALSVDITDPALWAESFAELERQVDEAVAAAAALNRSA